LQVNARSNSKKKRLPNWLKSKLRLKPESENRKSWTKRQKTDNLQSKSDCA